MIADVTYSTSLLFRAPDFCGYEMRHVPALHINFINLSFYLQIALVFYGMIWYTLIENKSPRRKHS